MKIKHSELTKKILADPQARDDFFRVMAGDRQHPVRLEGKEYYLMPVGSGTKTPAPPKAPQAG
jgi:hypothetical protein